MTPLYSRACGLVLALFPSACAERTAVPPSPCATLPEPAPATRVITFYAITSVVEIADSSVFVVNASDADVHLVRWSPLSIRRVIRTGRGPQEVTAPGELLRVSRSTFELFDVSTRRFLAIDSSGRVGTGRQWLSGSPQEFSAIYQPTPFAADSLGNVFAYALADRRQQQVFAITRCASPHDSRAAVCDTAARIPVAMLESPTAKTVVKQMTVGMLPPMGTFTVDVGGRVLVYGASDLAVHTNTAAGGWTKLATLPEIRVPVTAMAWEQIVATDSARTMEVVNHGVAAFLAAGGSLSEIPIGERSVVRSSERPTWFPPFARRHPLSGSDGHIFLERGHADGAAHVVTELAPDQTARCISMPSATRLVGVGRAYLYSAKATRAGDELLQRHPRLRERPSVRTRVLVARERRCKLMPTGPSARRCVTTSYAATCLSAGLPSQRDHFNHSHMNILPLPLLLALWSYSFPVFAQGNVPTRTLPEVFREHGVPFSSIASVAILSDGSALVTDVRDVVVKRIDFVNGVGAQVGRGGSGPAEYRLPTGLV